MCWKKEELPTSCYNVTKLSTRHKYILNMEEQPHPHTARAYSFVFLNSLQTDTIFSTNPNWFGGCNLNVLQMISVLGREENIVGKGQMLVTSILSFFQQCFPKAFRFKVINRFPNKPWFLRVGSSSLLKTLWEKGKMLVTSNFFFSHSVFYPFRELFVIYIKFEIVVCKLFHFERV